MAATPDETHRRWRHAPLTSLARLSADRPILVLAPHADDETIGCGGLIAQAAAAGIPVAVDILTDGSRSHPGSRAYDRTRLAALRRTETRNAVACLGVDPSCVGFWSERDSELPAGGPAAVPLVAALRRRIEETRAAAVFVTWIDDPHCDHQAAFALAIEAAGPVQATLYAYPVWSWTVDLPKSPYEGEVLRLDIGRELDTKRRAIACHASQLGRVVDDDPTGFALSDTELALFVQRYETFIAVVHPPKI